MLELRLILEFKKIFVSNYLPLIVRDILSKTDWGENEISIYSVLLEKGGMNISDLSTETGISISTLQYSIKKLMLKKMLTKNIVNKNPIYSASNIEQLKKWFKGVTKRYSQYQNVIAEFIQQYDFNPQMHTSKVRFYEGVKGVKQSYQQILEECHTNEIWSFFAAKETIEEKLHDYFMTDYVNARVKKAIRSKNIATYGITGKKYKLCDQEFLSETRLVPKGMFPTNNTEINLYDNYIHCMSFDEKSAFAIIIKDSHMADILKGIFMLVWGLFNDGKSYSIFMMDNLEDFSDTFESRKNLFYQGLEKEWANIKPNMKCKKGKETVLEIKGHEVMSSFELPYMQKLAEIVTRNGGNILNIGYGMGLIDNEIETYRKSRNLKKHYVVELNKYIANEAKKNKNLTVLEGDWHDVIKDFRGIQFDGIVYDGYPLKIEDLHRDAIDFIKKIIDRNLLKEDGILTFYVDAHEKLGNEFIEFLYELGLKNIQVEKVNIQLPKDKSQYWRHDHFLAPIIKYS